MKRVSDKNRNTDNYANETELAYIEKAKLTLFNSEEPKPELMTLADKYIGYYPIVAGQMCLQCHGEPKTDILPKTLAEIKKRHPYSSAIGYKTNELRRI